MSKYSKQDILEAVERLYEERGRFSMSFWDKSDEYPSKTAFYNKFDSTQEAFDILDIDNSHHSRQDLKDEMDRIVNKIGEVPTPEYITEKSKFAVNSFIREFGSWTESIEECGYQPKRNRGFNRQDLIDDLKRISQMDDVPSNPRMKDVTEYSKYGVGTYKREFGDWNDLLQEAGMEKRNRAKWIVSGEEHYAWKGGRSLYYGPSWYKQRKLARERDEYKCSVCSKRQKYMSRKLSVHHIRPRSEWDISNHEEMNELKNLVSLCNACHRKFEGKWKDTNRDEFVARAKELVQNE